MGRFMAANFTEQDGGYKVRSKTAASGADTQQHRQYEQLLH